MGRHHIINGEVVPFTPAEEEQRDAKEAAWEVRKPVRAFNRLRIERNRNLEETDFYSLSDVTMSMI